MEKDLRLLIRSKRAAELVKNYGLAEAMADPAAVPGLSELQRERLISIKAVTRHLSNFSEPGQSIGCSGDVYKMYRLKYGNRIKEQFIVLSLSSRNTILSECVCAIGNVNAVHIHPSDILRPAIVGGCPSVIVIHNHPSGDPSPSPEDRNLTERLASAAALMGVRLLDHVILAADSYYSFSDSGEI